MAADIAFVHSGRQRNEKKKTWEKEQTIRFWPWHVEMTDVELRRRYRFSKANILFILRLIKETACQSTQRSNPISAELRVNPQNTVFHQTFIVKCHLLSKRKSFYLVTAEWRHGTTQLSCKVRVAHQFRVEHCFIAMLLFLVLPIHISFKVFTKNAISIWTIFWKKPHFTPAEIFCQEWRCRRGGGAS